MDTLKINNIITLLKELPQQNIIELQNNLLLLNTNEYIIGSKYLPLLTTLPDDIDNIFNIVSEVLVQDINTVLLFSKKPFNLRINLSNEVFENLYQFSYVSSNKIDIYVSNHSTTDDVNISYLVSNTDLLGSSYVYS